MSRSLVSLRDATLADAEGLAELWQPFLRRGADDQLHDLATTIEQLDDRPGERLVVAEYDGVFAGAVFLRAATYSPVNPEPVLQVHNAAVVPAFRRRGIGKALVESAVTWAEELGIGHVGTAASSGSREANRFMARLALGPQAVLRIAPTPAVRARLTARHPGARQVTQVLAVRRSLRHARSMSGTASGG
ncbi:MAG TPA: GNAT family N-acetyltransferase [Nocardioides sp.]|jgi:GNAT superfamily N-acetyltransferase|nr:GNAT family N-acetyltransferase [Nocardioides sp.]